MKRFLVLAAVLAMVLVLGGPFSAQAYTVNDPSNDAIGDRVFETYGINVSDIYNTGGINISLFTNYPQAGYTVGSWATLPADLFITETYLGNQYQWAIPLVSHDGFAAGTMYAVGSFAISDDLEPAGGGAAGKPLFDLISLRFSPIACVKTQFR